MAVVRGAKHVGAKKKQNMGDGNILYYLWPKQTQLVENETKTDGTELAGLLFPTTR